MNSPSWREVSIQLNISKNRMKLDLPEPLAPMNTAACGRPEMSTSASDLKPSIRTDSIIVGGIILVLLGYTHSTGKLQEFASDIDLALVVDASSLTIHNALVALGAQARRAPATLLATESLPYPIYHASLQSRRNPYQGKSQGGSDNMVSPFGKLQF